MHFEKQRPSLCYSWQVVFIEYEFLFQYDRVLSLTHGPDSDSKLTTISVGDSLNMVRNPQTNKLLSAEYKLQGNCRSGEF